jgi:hypothetical protein
LGRLEWVLRRVRLEEGGDGEDGDCGHAACEGRRWLAWGLRSRLRQRERGAVDGGGGGGRLEVQSPGDGVDCELRAEQCRDRGEVRTLQTV